MEKQIDWKAAYGSEEFKKAKNNRLKFVIPLIGLFTAIFLALFTMQSYYQNIGGIKIVGEVDFGFFFVMSLFPLTGLLGISFVKYTQKNVYPYEELVVKNFSVKG